MHHAIARKCHGQFVQTRGRGDGGVRLPRAMQQRAAPSRDEAAGEPAPVSSRCYDCTSTFGSYHTTRIATPRSGEVRRPSLPARGQRHDSDSDKVERPTRAAERGA